MRFDYTILKQHTSRTSRYALLALIISLFAVGGLMAGGSASPQDKFKMADATTTEDNGSRLRPKAGFELVMKGKNTVVARKVSKPTAVSSDTVDCTCFISGSDTGKGQSCSATLAQGGHATCSGNCTKCSWVSSSK